MDLTQYLTWLQQQIDITQWRQEQAQKKKDVEKIRCHSHEEQAYTHALEKAKTIQT